MSGADTQAANSPNSKLKTESLGEERRAEEGADTTRPSQKLKQQETDMVKR